MKFCYVDESGVAGDSDWFLLGGFILDIEDAIRLDDEINEAIDLNWWEYEAMDTLKDLRKGSTFDIDRRNKLSDMLYEHLDSTMDYTICTIIFDQPEMDLEEEEHIYILGFKFLLERFQKLLERTNEYGSVYNDTHHLSPDIQEAHHHLQQGGSDFIDFENIAGVSAPISDELSRGIQMADLITAGVRAHFLGIESRYYTEHLLPHVDRNPNTGRIMGTGVKVFPDDATRKLSYHPNQESF